MLVDRSKRLLAWAVEPPNNAECVVARELLERVAPAQRPAAGTMLLADASYDSNPLHAAAAAAGVQLIAPRRRPDRGLGKSQTHHPNRLRAVELTERSTWWRDVVTHLRGAVERFFGTLATVGGGLWGLPAWARRLHASAPGWTPRWPSTPPGWPQTPSGMHKPPAGEVAEVFRGRRGA